MNMRRIKDQRGFTLVEIAIVLVIIGIILGGVLKGQEMITTARYKNLYNQYRGLLAGTYTYFDKYQRYPGDDNQVATRWPAPIAPVPTNGNINGFIDGPVAAAGMWCAAGAITENCQAFYHMRLANIISGSDTVAPTHAFGGNVAIVRSSGILPAMLGAAWNVPFAVCFQGLNNGTARWLEANYDDGVASTGSIRGDVDYMAAANLDDATTATLVCIGG